jgi:hypothetical protein
MVWGVAMQLLSLCLICMHTSIMACLWGLKRVVALVRSWLSVIVCMFLMGCFAVSCEKGRSRHVLQDLLALCCMPS